MHRRIAERVAVLTHFQDIVDRNADYALRKLIHEHLRSDEHQPVSCRVILLVIALRHMKTSCWPSALSSRRDTEYKLCCCHRALLYSSTLPVVEWRTRLIRYLRGESLHCRHQRRLLSCSIDRPVLAFEFMCSSRSIVLFFVVATTSSSQALCQGGSEMFLR